MNYLDLKITYYRYDTGRKRTRKIQADNHRRIKENLNLVKTNFRTNVFRTLYVCNWKDVEVLIISFTACMSNLRTAGRMRLTTDNFAAAYKF